MLSASWWSPEDRSVSLPTASRGSAAGCGLLGGSTGSCADVPAPSAGAAVARSRLGDGRVSPEAAPVLTDPPDGGAGCAGVCLGVEEGGRGGGSVRLAGLLRATLFMGLSAVQMRWCLANASGLRRCQMCGCEMCVDFATSNLASHRAQVCYHSRTSSVGHRNRMSPGPAPHLHTRKGLVCWLLLWGALCQGAQHPQRPQWLPHHRRPQPSWASRPCTTFGDVAAHLACRYTACASPPQQQQL